MARHGPTSLFLVLACASCATPPSQAPSLAPRPSEAIDPRVAVLGGVDQRPVDAALTAQLSALVGQAKSGDEAFQAAAAEAQRLASTAGAAQTESWVVAQQALSAAVAARAPTTRALGDIDAIAAVALATTGGIAPADLAVIESAAAEVGTIDRRQAQIIDALQSRLGN